MVDPEIATGEAVQLFTATHHTLGVIPNLVKVMANSPAVLKGYVDVLGVLGAQGTLSADLLERLALLVAQENRSDYCLSAHWFRGTKVAGLTVVEATHARRGESGDSRAAAALALAKAVVRDRGAVSDAQLAIVRQAGLTDGQIVEVIAQVAVNVLTNYLAKAARVDIDWPLVRHTD